MRVIYILNDVPIRKLDIETINIGQKEVYKKRVFTKLFILIIKFYEYNKKIDPYNLYNMNLVKAGINDRYRNIEM